MFAENKCIISKGGHIIHDCPKKGEQKRKRDHVPFGGSTMKCKAKQKWKKPKPTMGLMPDVIRDEPRGRRQSSLSSFETMLSLV